MISSIVNNNRLVQVSTNIIFSLTSKNKTVTGFTYLFLFSVISFFLINLNFTRIVIFKVLTKFNCKSDKTSKQKNYVSYLKKNQLVTSPRMT